MKTERYIIENSFIKKELTIEKNRIKSFSYFNKVSERSLTALEGSEVFLLSFGKGFFKKKIKASDLKIKGTTERIESASKRHELLFEPFRVKDSTISLTLVYETGDNDFFLRKHLEFEIIKQGAKDVVLDCIDFENLSFNEGLSYWTVPKQEKSHIPGFALGLGQPVYVDSMFFGFEFPVCLTEIKENTTSVKYYNGRTLKRLCGGKSFITESFVAGCGDGNLKEQVQKAFFSYIKTISKPVRLRRQYNSWYDHMLNITRENVTSSFLENEKGLTFSGEPALDSYVADDGWNDYDKDFWSFNEKFPDELYPFSKLSEALGSNFGLWLGPRGGYTNDTPKFAKRIEKAGNGYYNKQAHDICVTSTKYHKKTTELMLDFEERFSLNYWKLDGFAQFPCKSKKHDHMVGGYKDMYFYNDSWEKWIDTFNRLQENGSDNFWINLTCYAWPSPWFLRYVNSLWMQISDDVGFIGKKDKVSDKDRMLSYRDEKYYDFYNVRDFQFPQMGLYNHDPIYGNTAKVSMSDDDFRSYLFTMATRGSFFWEYYYSHNMMNENKWLINYACMRFIEDNKDVLSNAVIFGKRPSENGVYGYSCFSDYEGIVSLRNSSVEEKEYTLVLNEAIGVKKTLVPVNTYIILPYTADALCGAYGYGDKVKVTLKPYETKIFHFGKSAKQLKATFLKALDSRTLKITFNQTVNTENLTCKENEIEKLELLADYMTAIITFRKDFDRMNTLTLCDLKDIMGNSESGEVKFDYYENHEVTEGFYGDGEFTIKATLDKNAKGELYRQGNEVYLQVSDGHILFGVGLTSVLSYARIEDVVQLTAVRERNGVLKLYINGVLDCGEKSERLYLSGEKGKKYDENKVVLYNEALPYDKV